MKIVNRRNFMAGTLAASVIIPLSGENVAAEVKSDGDENEKKGEGTKEEGITDTPPVLQTAAETSMGVAWGVKVLASGFVLVSTDEEKLAEVKGEDARNPEFSVEGVQKFYTGVWPLASIEERVLSVQMEGLAPGTKYFYRTGTFSVEYPNAYQIKTGAVQLSPIYSFVTSGKGAESSFAVINDTHANYITFQALDKKLKEMDAAVTIWNGDLGEMYSEDYAVRTLLYPGQTEYAVRRPVLFVPGNHDYRGAWVRNLEKVLINRLPVEKSEKYWKLGRNFAIRQGELALIGLDTGEDKPDRHPVFKGMANFEPYRRLQAEWLEEVLQKPEIASAPYVVAFCHIPLHPTKENANPGDLLEGFAYWHRPSNQLWGPVLTKHGVQVVIVGHMHKYSYHPAEDGRSWAQVVGGAPDIKHATVIEGRVTGDKLKIKVCRVYDNEILGEWTYNKREIHISDTL
ncbi:MAG: FN3 domain-containing metallophosphoesterase family protein [Planctomycetia bacterium]|nr:FN3 domain-containing metallophosphoesterase family protein [Planctomycetia bacterium]